MKINFVQTIIAIAVSLLIAYGLYSFHDSENKILLSAGSFVFLATTLIITIGTSFELPRTTTNIRVVSGIFFAVALISNLFNLQMMLLQGQLHKMKLHVVGVLKEIKI